MAVYHTPKYLKFAMLNIVYKVEMLVVGSNIGS
jgi:hypothetical protein